MIKHETQKVTITNTKGQVVYSSSSKKEDMGVMLNIAIGKATDFCEKEKSLHIVDGFIDGVRTCTHRIDSDR